jgi:hypothetical protein
LQQVGVALTCHQPFGYLSLASIAITFPMTKKEREKRWLARRYRPSPFETIDQAPMGPALS